MRFVVTAGLAAFGEVLPFVAIATALKRRGHDVCFIGNPVFEDRAAGAGLRFVAVGSTADYAALQSDTSLFGDDRADGRQIVERYLLRHMADYYRVVEHEIATAPAIVVSNEPGSAMAAEKHARPLVTAFLSPARMRSRFDPPHPERFLPGWTGWLTRSPSRLALVGRVSGLFTEHSGPMPGKPAVPPDNPFARLRLAAGLPPFERSTLRASLSLCLWPEWFGAPQPDWPEEAVLCGFPSEAPEGAALAGGMWPEGTRPTLVATTGSLATSQEPFFATVSAACQTLGWGGVLVTPHGDQVPSALPPHVIHVTNAPFGALFPRAAVVVHHGGVGTMARALAAGVPQVISPIRGEQFDIGNRAVRLGVARMMSVGQVGAAALAHTLQDMARSSRVARECDRWKTRLASAPTLDVGVVHLERLAMGHP